MRFKDYLEEKNIIGKEIKYHKDIYFPINWKEDYNKFYSSLPENIEQSAHWSRGRSYKHDFKINKKDLKQSEVFELAYSVPDGELQKVVYRVTKMDTKDDVGFVVSKEGKMVTSWLNKKTDIHRTLDSGWYAKREMFFVIKEKYVETIGKNHFELQQKHPGWIEDDVEIFKNPTQEEFNSIVKRTDYNEVARGIIIIQTGDLYVWDANGLHNEMSKISNEIKKIAPDVYDKKKVLRVVVSRRGNIKLADFENCESLEVIKTKVNAKNSACRINMNLLKNTKNKWALDWDA